MSSQAEITTSPQTSTVTLQDTTPPSSIKPISPTKFQEEMDATRGASNSATLEAPLSPAKPSSPNAIEPASTPRTLSFHLVLLSIYLSFFLIALDRMIIATAVPSITNTFTSIADIGWYGSAYMLTCAIFMPLFGPIYRFYDVKTVFMCSVGVFEVGSAVCGAAPTSAGFIVGRAVAGIGAAGINVGAIMIVVNLVPLHKRPVFTSFFGMAFGVSSVLGPIIGGLFTDAKSLTWRWCFYINLPIGAFTLLVIFFFLHSPPSPPEKQAAASLTLLEKAKRLDPLGLLFLVPSIVCLILALQWGGTKYAWSSARVVVLLVVFSLTFLGFLFVEYKFPDTAMAPTRVVLNRSVGCSLFFTFMSSAGMMCAVYYLAIWFQAAQGQSAMEAGIRTIPMVIAIVIMGIIMGVLVQKIGYYVPPLLIAPVLAAVGSGMMSTLTPSSRRAEWIGYQVIYGLGIGSGAQSASLAAQTVLAREDVPLGTAMSFFMQQIGGAIFVPVGQNLFSTQLLKRLSGVGGLDPEMILNTGATDLKKVVAAGQLGIVVDAYSFACTRVFVLGAALSAMMMIGALGVEWKSIKKGKSGAEKVDEEKAGKETEE